MLSTLLGGVRRRRHATGGYRLLWIVLTLGLFGMSADALAHAVAEGDKGYIRRSPGLT